jgi:hypothetical protein
MRSMALFLRFWSVPVLGLLGGAACAPLPAMKTPSTEPPARVLPVTETRAGRTDPVTSMRIGNAHVRAITGTPIYAPGTTPYGRAPDPDTRKYRFELVEGAVALQAECSEQARDAPYFGLGKSTIDLYCTCQQGARVRAALQVSEGRGEAALPNNTRLAVWEAHEDERGRRGRPILGYRFRNQQQEAAIDITTRPRAYLPGQLEESQRLPLTCLFAALLLHRPIK